jgi:hypothetical protein
VNQLGIRTLEANINREAAKNKLNAIVALPTASIANRTKIADAETDKTPIVKIKIILALEGGKVGWFRRRLSDIASQLF